MEAKNLDCEDLKTFLNHLNFPIKAVEIIAEIYLKNRRILKERLYKTAIKVSLF